MGSKPSKGKVPAKTSPQSKKPANNAASPPAFPEPPQPETSKEIQGPDSLETAQEQYASRHRAAPDPGTGGRIPPFPTPDKRRDVYDDHMADIDEHVLDASENLATGKISDLVKHLIGPANNDVSKARALYKWLTSQRVEEYNITEDPTEDSILFDLLLVRAKQMNLNHVYKKMCQQANIPCELVRGTNRPWGYHYGSELTSGHVWCAVYVARGWRLVDAHLGTCFLGNPQEIASPRGLKYQEVDHTPRTVQAKEIPNLSSEFIIDFFFLTDPYVFIYYNLPDDVKWQLLAIQVTKEQFKHMVFLTPSYFEMNISKLSHMKGKVTGDKGRLLIQVNLPTKPPMRCSYSITKLAGTSASNKVNGTDLKSLCFLKNSGQQRTLEINMKVTGRYKIVLYASDITSNQPLARQICHYYVDVSDPCHEALVLPANPRHEYGPGADTSLHHVSAKSHLEPSIQTNDGNVAIKFQCDPAENKSFTTELVSVQNSRNILVNHLRNSLSHTGELASYIKLPDGGYYIYKLFVLDEKSGQSSNICTYLIESTVGHEDIEPFPVGVSGFIGDVSHTDLPWLEPKSHKSPIIECDESGEITIEMDVHPSINLDVQTHLELVNITKVSEPSEYTWYIYRPGTLTIDISFPYAGIYGFSIFAKESGKDGMMRRTWIYVINVDTPVADTLPYPVVLAGWNTSCELRSPLSGYLVENQVEEFDVRVPWARDVVLTTKSWVCESLEEKAGGWMKGQIQTRNVGGVITVAALEDKTNYVYLLEYKVLSSQEHQRMLVQQKQARSQASSRRRALEHRRQAEVERAEQRRSEAKRQAEELELAFTRDREKLGRDEGYFRAQEREVWRQTAEDYYQTLLTQPGAGVKEAELVAKQVVDIQELQNSDLSTRRSIHKDMRTHLVRERLREGTKLRRYDMLKPALENFLDLGMEEKQQDLTRARRTMDTLQAKHDLRSAMAEGDTTRIQQCIAEIHRRGLHGRLQVDVQEAERLVDSLQRVHRLKMSVLWMDKATMGEIRSYTRPPAGVHRVMQASLLLLGKDEFTTAEWTACQKMCSLHGPDNLNRRILDLNIQDIHPEIVSRVLDILEHLDLGTVQRLSAGATTFYVWAIGTAEELEKMASEEGRERAPPADIHRQREIFGRAEVDDRALASKNMQHHKHSTGYQAKEWII